MRHSVQDYIPALLAMSQGRVLAMLCCLQPNGFKPHVQGAIFQTRSHLSEGLIIQKQQTKARNQLKRIADLAKKGTGLRCCAWLVWYASLTLIGLRRPCNGGNTNCESHTSGYNPEFMDDFERLGIHGLKLDD